MSQRTILVVEDEAKLRALVSSYLERAGHTVLQADTAGGAKELAPGVDLMILDLGLPDQAGEDVARWAHESLGQSVIMLTAKASEAQRVAGLRLGADDYVTKPFSLNELVARVEAVLRRSSGGLGSPGPASFGEGALRIDSHRREVWVDDDAVSLTRTEFDLLGVLAARPGRVWPRLELASRLYEEHDTLERTIDAHVKNLRRKLGDRRGQSRLVATVSGVGYKLAVDRDA